PEGREWVSFMKTDPLSVSASSDSLANRGPSGRLHRAAMNHASGCGTFDETNPLLKKSSPSPKGPPGHRAGLGPPTYISTTFSFESSTTYAANGGGRRSPEIRSKRRSVNRTL